MKQLQKTERQEIVLDVNYFDRSATIILSG